jgi:hypothetical protein
MIALGSRLWRSFQLEWQGCGNVNCLYDPKKGSLAAYLKTLADALIPVVIENTNNIIISSQRFLHSLKRLKGGKEDLESSLMKLKRRDIQ